MNIAHLLPFRNGAKSLHLVGHIADVPQVVDQVASPGKVMVFHLVECPDIEFRLKMLPTTPVRHRGDRVELTYTPRANGIATVEALHSAPDSGETRRRNAEYLRKILDSTTRNAQ